jgi:HK97 family phage portal protein
MKQTRWGKLTQLFKQPLRRVYQRLHFYNGNNYQFSAFSGNAYDSDPVRSAIDAIARNGAKLTPRHIRKMPGGITIPSSAIIEDLLQLRPNPYMNAYSFFYKVITQKFLRNNAFIYVDRPDGLTVAGLYPVVPTGVEFLESAGDLFVKFYFGNGAHTVLPYDDIIHLRRFYADNDLLGEQSQAFTAKLQAIQTADEGIAHAIETTANLKGIMKFNQMLKGDDMKAYKDKFVSDYLDLNENGSGIAAMDSRADYVPLKQKPTIIDKAQSDYLKQAVYEYYGVNDAIITSNYNEDQWNAFYEGVLEPLALEMGTEFTSKIFSGRQRGHGNRIFFEANRLQYASNQTKVNLVKEAAPYGVISRNEIREIFNMSPLPDDKRFQTLNVVDDEIARDYQMTKGGKAHADKID